MGHNMIFKVDTCSIVKQKNVYIRHTKEQENMEEQRKNIGKQKQPWGSWYVELSRQRLQAPIWNILKELMEIMHEESMEGIKIMFHQILNINKYWKLLKKNQIEIMELKNTLHEMKISFTSRFEQA